MCRLFGLDIDGAIADAARVSEAVARDPDPMAEILALCVEVFARNALGDTAVAVEIGNRAVTLADATPAGSGHRLHPNLFRGVALLSFGERTAALAAFTRGRQLGEALGAAWALPIYHFTVALAHWDAGEWDDLLAEVNAGIAYGEEEGSSIGQVWAFAIAGRVHLYRGNLDAAAAALDRGDAVLEKSGLQVGADWLALSRALLLEAQARRAEGVELLGLVWETAAALQATASLTLVGGELARLALETGDEALAERVVSALGEIAAHMPHDRIVGARERRARGLARREPEPLLEAVGLLEAIDHRFEAALVRAEAADLLAAAGQADDAALLLDASLTFFESMGAHAAAERARSRLARLRQARRRGPAPRRAVAGWDSLTPTEWEVVEEVCAGRSNGQVAERLGVSRRTVEAHLRSIYAKLGVVGLECLEGGFQRAGERREVGPLVGIALDRGWGLQGALDAVRRRRRHGCQGQVRVGVGAGPSALEPPQLGTGRTDGANGAGAVLVAPRGVDRGEPSGDQPLVRVDRGVEQERGGGEVVHQAGDGRAER